MRIALDAMGGDNAPKVEVAGAVRALKELKDVIIILVGDSNRIKKLLDDDKDAKKVRDRIEIEDAKETVSMSEAPAQAYKTKPESSIAIAAKTVKEGRAEALISAGNTGAVVVFSLLGVGRIPGVLRPAILTTMPSEEGVTAVIDSGANVDCKPVHLAQFAVMGNMYSKYILGVENPRVGLISVGAEEEKGNELTVATGSLIKKLNLNFIGNAEGHDVTNGNADVIVCDGFVGNVILKTAEGIAHLLFSMIKKSVKKSFLLAKIGAFLIKGIFRSVIKSSDPNEHGGAPLLGIKKPVIICHGRSNEKGIMNAIKVAEKFIKRHINDEIEAAVKNMEDGKNE